MVTLATVYRGGAISNVGGVMGVWKFDDTLPVR